MNCLFKQKRQVSLPKTKVHWMKSGIDENVVMERAKTSREAGLIYTSILLTCQGPGHLIDNVRKERGYERPSKCDSEGCEMALK